MERHEWAALNQGTPQVTVRSSGGFMGRVLRLLRQPNYQHRDSPVRLLLSRSESSPAERTIRLFGSRPLKDTEDRIIADACTVSALCGKPLLTHTVDADAALTLTDVEARPLWKYNAQGTTNRTLYEAAAVGGRKLALVEQPSASAARIREAFVYASVDQTQRQRNLVGSITTRCDNAGVQQTYSMALTGHVLDTRQRLLHRQASLPDWSGASADDLETEVLTVTAIHDAVGLQLAQTNAAGVTTLTIYDIAGAVSHTSLRHGDRALRVLASVRRRADGTTLSQTMGNGVVDTYSYDPRTHYLDRHTTARAQDHSLGAQVIVDLLYTYDPVGNIVQIDDQSCAATWFRNERISGLREYRYDTLYRLLSATGRERRAVNRGPTQVSAGSVVWRRYTEAYRYDDGDNLTHINHDAGFGARTRHLVVSARCNRALPQDHCLTPDTGFFSGGLQKKMADGRTLSWQADNQLAQVDLVVRTNAHETDNERYHYADGGTRTRKVHSVAIAHGRRFTVTTYAGGCERRQRFHDNQIVPQVDIHISDLMQARWVEDRLTRDSFLRYSFTDHLGSCGGETDAEGNVVSREEYAPYGGTVALDEAAIEVSRLIQRTQRHAGKELDASGLYYYGWRYYQALFGRWLSADPGGLSDGLNLFCMSGNSPVRYFDKYGQNKIDSVELSKPFEYFAQERSGYPASETMLEKVRSQVQQGAERTRELRHRVFSDGYTVRSVYLDTKDKDFEFTNKYKPHMWMMVRNYRAPGSKSFASDVVLKQYSLVASKNGFFGQLPEVILRYNVLNKEAREAMTLRDEEKCLSVSEQRTLLTRRFLESPGNGKSTQRILEAFGMEATGVERVDKSDQSPGSRETVMIAVYVKLKGLQVQPTLGHDVTALAHRAMEQTPLRHSQNISGSGMKASGVRFSQKHLRRHSI